MVSIEAKKLFLTEVLRRRDVLMGKFNDLADGKRKKLHAWTEIKSILAAQGVDRTIVQLRDTLWKNLRIAALKKVDESRKTGTGGGPERQLTDIDNLVLDIIGRGSAAVEGLDIEESSVGPPVTRPIQTEHPDTAMGATNATGSPHSSPGAKVCDQTGRHTPTTSMASLLAGSDRGGCTSAPSTPVKKPLKRSAASSDDEKEELLRENLRLRNEKLRLEIDILRKQYC